MRLCVLRCAVQVRATDMGRRGGTKIDSSILRQVEHADLINYGLIPEFVGRLPVIVSLQVCVCEWSVWGRQVSIGLFLQWNLCTVLRS
jgi:hypothetical protein